MSSLPKLSGTVGTLGAFLAGALVVGGVAWAADQNQGTTINACQVKSTGTLRILTTGTCKSTEVAVSWNSTGPQGAVGPQGQQGVQGPKGERGPAVYEYSLEALKAAVSVPSTSLEVGASQNVPPNMRMVLLDIQAGTSRQVYDVTFGRSGIGAVVNRCQSCQPEGFYAFDGTHLVDLGLSSAEGSKVTLNGHMGSARLVWFPMD